MELSQQLDQWQQDMQSLIEGPGEEEDEGPREGGGGKAAKFPGTQRELLPNSDHQTGSKSGPVQLQEEPTSQPLEALVT